MRFIVVVVAVVLTFLVFRSMTEAGTIPQVGAAAPDFSLPDAALQTHSLTDYSGQWLVLYFYPKDDTPGCTREACTFRDDMLQLEQLGAKVVGISVDDSSSHARFAKKYSLPFPLLSDTDGSVAHSYGALTNLLLFKIAKRQTYLIDPSGQIAKVYLSVDTSKHSQQIIDDLKLLTDKKASQQDPPPGMDYETIPISLE